MKIMPLQQMFTQIVLLVLLIGARPITIAQTTASAERRAVEFTFLKSAPGQREALKKFIVANWFAMDEIAAKRGLMKSYTMLDSDDDAEPWNVMVAVTYMDAKGFAGIQSEFEKIRAEHKTVLVDGKRMPELGRVVGSRLLFEAAK